MKKILFLHGFFASGQCVPALALREAFKGSAEVVTPDLPIHPKEALRFIRELTDKEKPDVLVGNSCGAFYAQMIAPTVGIPALLGNPHFRMTEFLKPRIGAHQYKSPRKDGNQDFIINEQLIAEFAEVEAHQFDTYSPAYKERIWGIFGEQDTLAHFEPLFLQYYTHSFHFPGGHTPTAEEVHQYYVPLIEKNFAHEKLEKMKIIAIPTREGMVDDHFGHCAYYTVITLDEENQVVKQERLDSPEGCGCKSNIASVMQEMGITLMLAGNMGMGAYNKLMAHGIAVIRGCHGKVDEVLKAYQNGELKDSLEACDHHDCDHHEEKPVFVVPSIGK